MGTGKSCLPTQSKQANGFLAQNTTCMNIQSIRPKQMATSGHVRENVSNNYPSYNDVTSS
jgi:hypothetical protein